jgi:SpoVK/Ycf46/Vps4 family AAA+-type ATPase
MLKKTKVDFRVQDAPEILLERTFSGADMEAILTRAKFRAVSEAKGRAKSDAVVTAEILEEVVEDFIPPTYPLEVEMQNLAAVLECTSRNMLPDKYRNMDREDMVRRVEELKLLVR